MRGTREIFLLGLFEAISLLYFGRCCPGAFVLANSRLSASPCLRKCCLGASVWTVPSCCFRRFCPGAGVYPQVPADVKRKNLCSLLKPNIQILSLVIPSNQIVETTRCTHRDYLGEASTEAGNTLPFLPGGGERQYWGSSRQVQNVECSSLTTSTWNWFEGGSTLSTYGITHLFCKDCFCSLPVNPSSVSFFQKNYLFIFGYAVFSSCCSSFFSSCQ